MFARVTLRSARHFSSAFPKFSFIGKSPVRLSDGVECFTEEIPFEFCKSFTKGKDTITLNRQIVVRGPRGVMKLAVPEFVSIAKDHDQITVSVEDPKDKIQRSIWGTSRALIQNHVIGTSEGHLAVVKFVGTGYRASIEKDGEDSYVALKVGYPYTPRLKVPEGITVTSPNPTRLLIEGVDKQQVTLFAARIREYRKPEPYKGKGIFVGDETIKLKQKKIK